MCLLLTAWSCESRGTDSYEVTWAALPEVASVQLVLESEAGSKVSVGVEYPWWKVMLVSAERVHPWQEGVPYEGIYHGSTDHVGRGQLPKYSLGSLGSPYSVRGLRRSRRVDSGNVERITGWCNENVFVGVEGVGASTSDLAAIAESLATGRMGCIARGVLPRISAEQWMRGRWEPLTRFARGSAQFRFGPADTLVLRIHYAAMAVAAYVDHVEVTPLPRAEAGEWQFEWRESGSGIGAAAGIVLSGQLGHVDRPTTVRIPRAHVGGVGDMVVVAVRRGRVDATQSWAAVDSRVECTRGCQLPVTVFTFLGAHPELYSSESKLFREATTNWPLAVTLELVQNGVRAPEGYPGFGDVPEWAIEEGRRLGQWTADSDTARAHWHQNRAKSLARKG